MASLLARLNVVPVDKVTALVSGMATPPTTARVPALTVVLPA
jgi:hypothetical protein